MKEKKEHKELFINLDLFSYPFLFFFLFFSFGKSSATSMASTRPVPTMVTLIFN